MEYAFYSQWRMASASSELIPLADLAQLHKSRRNCSGRTLEVAANLFFGAALIKHTRKSFFIFHCPGLSGIVGRWFAWPLRLIVQIPQNRIQRPDNLHLIAAVVFWQNFTGKGIHPIRQNGENFLAR